MCAFPYQVSPQKVCFCTYQKYLVRCIATITCTFLVQSSVLYVECKTSILQSKLKQYRFVAHRVLEGVGIDQHKRL